MRQLTDNDRKAIASLDDPRLKRLIEKFGIDALTGDMDTSGDLDDCYSDKFADSLPEHLREAYTRTRKAK